jgi:hypothetical protein
VRRHSQGDFNVSQRPTISSAPTVGERAERARLKPFLQGTTFALRRSLAETSIRGGFMLREEFALLLARGARLARLACAVTAVTLSSTAAMAQSLATYQLTAGWATFGLALAKGEATER